MTKDFNKLAKISRMREVMATLFRDGKTLAEIGLLMGCTHQNVARHLKIHGVSSECGGQAKKMQDRLTARIAKKDARFIKKYGCTYAEYRSIRDLLGRPVLAFHYHRCHAKARGIAWEFSLPQWWSIWQDSGKWEQRGPGQGYCMCRYGDEGPYAPGNVFIDTIRANSSRDYCKASGLPLGVYMDRGRYKATRCYDGKKYWLGAFPTPELAHAAYLAVGGEV